MTSKEWKWYKQEVVVKGPNKDFGVGAVLGDVVI